MIQPSYVAVAIIGLLAWGLLAVRALRARRIGTARALRLALIWIAILGIGWVVATLALRIHPLTNFT